MEKKMENEMETGGMFFSGAPQSYFRLKKNSENNPQVGHEPTGSHKGFRG